MASVSSNPKHVSDAGAARQTPRAWTLPHPPRFDILMAVLGLWFVGGLFVDGWAHTHDKVDQSFFTPWHAVLYSGWAVNASALFITALIGHARGAAWRASVPSGYFPSLLGAFGFGLGGLGDLAWHTAFGIERGIEALLSPTHLLLAVSMGALVSGPFRAAVARRTGAQASAIMSLTLALAVVTFFTQSAHPVAQLWGLGSLHNYRDDDFAATALLLGGAIFAAATLFLLKLGKPMPGAFAMLFGINAAAMGLLNPYVYPLKWVAAFAIGGAALDALGIALASAAPMARRRVLAALTPVCLIGAHFAASQFGPGLSGITWRIHFWLGILVLTALGGWLLAHLSGETPDGALP